MWIILEHPPLRTIEDTWRWYKLFLPLASIIVYSRCHHQRILSFSTLLTTSFICVNLF
uniref:hypothetical protein n=1 Tax=Hoylesella pleuritidis TaxID=407975 RepID=UPI00131ED4AC